LKKKRSFSKSMAPILTPVSAIVAGRINIKFQARVIHLWTVQDFNNPTEDIGIHMLLIDDKVSAVTSTKTDSSFFLVYVHCWETDFFFCVQLGKIQASGKKDLVPKIKTLVEEGAAYEIESVLVAHNNPKYKVTDHRFKINLMDRTKFTKLTNTNIPKTHFDFVSFRTILEADREDKCVGNIIFCGSYLVR
jgi:hypothetical protein